MFKFFICGYFSNWVFNNSYFQVVNRNKKMIFFFGTRPGKTEIKLLDDIVCPYCEQTGTLTVSRTRNWFHFFWIKIFKISNNTIAECSHCKRVYGEKEFTEEMKTVSTNS